MQSEQQHYSIQGAPLGINFEESSQLNHNEDAFLALEGTQTSDVSASYQETLEEEELLQSREHFIRSAAPTPQLPVGSPSGLRNSNGPRATLRGHQIDAESENGTDSLQVKEENEEEEGEQPPTLQDSHESLESVEPMTDLLGHKVKASDPLVHKTKQKLLIIAQEEERVMKITDEANRRVFQLKLQEIKLEEDLIRTGTHPDYIAKLQEIETKKDSTLAYSRDYLKYSIENEDAFCDGQIKFAEDTFWERKKIIRKRIMEHVHSLRNQLFIEYGKLSTSKGLPVPMSLGKRKRLQADQLSLGPGFTAEIPMPEWIRHVLKIRRRAGLESVPVPSPCLGLDVHEIEQDLSFFHTLREALADKSAESAEEHHDGDNQQVSPQELIPVKNPPQSLQV